MTGGTAEDKGRRKVRKEGGSCKSQAGGSSMRSCAGTKELADPGEVSVGTVLAIWGDGVFSVADLAVVVRRGLDSSKGASGRPGVAVVGGADDWGDLACGEDSSPLVGGASATPQERKRRKVPPAAAGGE